MISTLIVAAFVTAMATPIVAVAIWLWTLRKKPTCTPAELAALDADSPGATAQSETFQVVEKAAPPLVLDDPAVTHVVPQDATDFVIPDFRPGFDRVELRMNSMGVEFEMFRTDAGWLGNGIYFGNAACTTLYYAHPGKRKTRFMGVARVALGKSKEYKKTGINRPFCLCHLFWFN